MATTGSATTTTLWSSILPILQDINNYGGNFISIFVNRAVIDEIERLAGQGDQTMIFMRNELARHATAIRYPDQHQAFNGLFECYHEALFYLLALRRGITLQSIARTAQKTADFRTSALPIEAFEIKTIDFTGGALAYTDVQLEGLNQRIKATERARATGVGMGEQVISPHGEAKDNLDVIRKVMQQVDRNVKRGQFESYPTFLVVPMVRTALRTGPDELYAEHDDATLGGRVSGHSWTIAAHRVGAPFRDANREDDVGVLGTLDRNGVLRDHAFVAGIIFIETKWNGLPSCDFHHPFPGDSFRLHGVWNDEYDPPDGVRKAKRARSSFSMLCDHSTGLSGTTVRGATSQNRLKTKRRVIVLIGIVLALSVAAVVYS